MGALSRRPKPLALYADAWRGIRGPGKEFHFVAKRRSFSREFGGLAKIDTERLLRATGKRGSFEGYEIVLIKGERISVRWTVLKPSIAGLIVQLTGA